MSMLWLALLQILVACSAADEADIVRSFDFHVDISEFAAAEQQQRIALITNSYDRNIDGVALTLNRLVAHLLRRGHEVLVIVPTPGRHQQIPALRAAGAPVIRVPSLAFPVWREYRLTWRLGRDARRQLAAFAPTVMHIAIQDGLGHAAQRWARARGIPVVCSHHTRFERYLNYYASIRPLALQLERLYWWGMRRFHGQCAATLPPSGTLARDLEAHGIPRVGIWYRGVDRTLFTPAARDEAWRQSVGGAPDAPMVLLVARLRWEKGLRTFAAVVSQLAARGVAVRVAIVGDGPARSGLAKLLPQTATFFGTLTGAPLATAYASADIFVNPSTTEGWGATCLEAQAAALPVVATISSGIVEVLQDGVGGFLVNPHNVSALTEKVVMLAESAELRGEMGRRAVVHAAGFDWERSGDRMLCEYRKHVSNASAPRSRSRSSSTELGVGTASASASASASTRTAGARPVTSRPPEQPACLGLLDSTEPEPRRALLL
jgi:phosphatidylinositol alpha 1,6-mannosyltransferase